ncbi:MAG: hypothetical protein KGL53_00120, partial [Elusimicrobia bacterium]|nr:hypothetical protein [Elusimicrobiota bacterium]
WQELYRRLSADPEVLRRKAWGAVCGAFGEACFSDERLAAAQAWADAALAAPPAGDPPPGWTAAVHLVRGLSLDMRRRIKDARGDYQAVIDDPAAPFPVRSLARACMAQWCSRDRVFSFRKL